MKKKYLFLCVLFFSLLLSVHCNQVLAEQKDTVYELISPYTENSDVVWKIQRTLEELYYLSPEDDYSAGKFDDATINALRNFCADNHIDSYLVETGINQGISPRLQKFILEESPKPKLTPTSIPPTNTPAPSPTVFPVFLKGQNGGEIVGNVQTCLYRLHYFDGIEGKYTIGVFDEVTEKALIRFCEIIHSEYKAEDGISLPLYNRITSTDAPENPPVTEAPLNVIYYDSEGDDVNRIQQLLRDLGYFRDLPEPENGHYDAITQQAVELFCNVNNVPLYIHGINQEIWQRMNSPAVLTNPPQFKNIFPDEQSEQVASLQNRLFELGYYKDRQRTGIADRDMFAASADFAAANHIAYEESVLSVPLQNAILSEHAVPYSEQLKQLGFMEKASNFLTYTVYLFGISMPLYLAIMLVLIILTCLVFLLIHTFSIGNNQKSVLKYADPSSRVRQKTNAVQIQLDITYRQHSQSITLPASQPISIGRIESSLPIDAEDTDMSRKHCDLVYQDGTLVLFDHSTNGTSVNGQIYKQSQTILKSGDVLQAGRHMIIVHILT